MTSWPKMDRPSAQRQLLQLAHMQLFWNVSKGRTSYCSFSGVYPPSYTFNGETLSFVEMFTISTAVKPPPLKGRCETLGGISTKKPCLDRLLAAPCDNRFVGGSWYLIQQPGFYWHNRDFSWKPHLFGVMSHANTENFHIAIRLILLVTTYSY